MHRANFLKAIAGLGAFGMMPKKDEENPVITSEDGRTAWDGEGNQVYQESITWAEGDLSMTTANYIPAIVEGDLIYMLPGGRFTKLGP